MRRQNLDENPRLLNQADARRDADAFRADAMGKRDDLLDARQPPVICPLDLRSRVSDGGLRVLAAVLLQDLLEFLVVRRFGQTKAGKGLVLAVTVELVAVRAGEVWF